jgi:Mycoplasma protein of unknown function, DUF285
MVWFRSAAVFLLLLNENVVAASDAVTGSSEGMAASPVDAASDGTMEANAATNEEKRTPGRRVQAKRRKPISHAHKRHVKAYNPSRQLHYEEAAPEAPYDPYHEHHYDTKATIHKPTHKPIPYTKGKGYDTTKGKGYYEPPYVEYEYYEYRSKAMMGGSGMMGGGGVAYDRFGPRSKAMMGGSGMGMSGGGGGGGDYYYDYEYYGYDEYGMPYPLYDYHKMPEKKPVYPTDKPVYHYQTEKPVYDGHHATIKPGYGDDDYVHKKPTVPKYYYYYEPEPKSKAMMGGSKKSKMSGPDYYDYEYPMYGGDDHYHHEIPAKGGGGGGVPVAPPYAGPPSSGPPTVPTPGGTPAPVGGGGTQCFDDFSILSAAVDQYIMDPSPDSALADTYGFPIGQWCVSGVTSFGYLFSIARNAAMSTFNEDLSSWDVSGGVDFYAMFEGTAIDQDFSTWVSKRIDLHLTWL